MSLEIPLFKNHTLHTSVTPPAFSYQFTRLPDSGSIERYLASTGANVTITLPSSERVSIPVGAGCIVLSEQTNTSDSDAPPVFTVSSPRTDSRRGRMDTATVEVIEEESALYV